MTTGGNNYNQKQRSKKREKKKKKKTHKQTKKRNKKTPTRLTPYLRVIKEERSERGVTISREERELFRR